MAKYLLHGNYVGDGIKGLLEEGGSKRREAVVELTESLGGSLESMYYAFGKTDVYLIVDMPDHAAVTALSLAASGTGLVTVETTVLMNPEDIDKASSLSPNYRAPGQ